MNYSNLPTQLRANIAAAAKADAEAAVELFAASMHYDILDPRIELAAAAAKVTSAILYKLQVTAAELMKGN